MDPFRIILDQPRADKDPFSVGMNPSSTVRWLHTACRIDPHRAGHSKEPVPLVETDLFHFISDQPRVDTDPLSVGTDRSSAAHGLYYGLPYRSLRHLPVHLPQARPTAPRSARTRSPAAACQALSMDPRRTSLGPFLFVMDCSSSAWA